MKLFGDWQTTTVTAGALSGGVAAVLNVGRVMVGTLVLRSVVVGISTAATLWAAGRSVRWLRSTTPDREAAPHPETPDPVEHEPRATGASPGAAESNTTEEPPDEPDPMDSFEANAPSRQDTRVPPRDPDVAWDDERSEDDGVIRA